MRIPVIMMLAATPFLQGCVGVVLYDGARQNTRPLVEAVMADAMPGADPKAAADCVAKAMTVPETIQLGVTDTRVVTAKARAEVLDYAKRPKAASCLAGLPIDNMISAAT